jgi:hypothetical protein
MTRGRVPRELHPVAWWIWAVGLVIAANRTTNPLLLVLLLAVLGLVVANRRGSAPWARAFRYYLILGGVVIALRVVLRCVFGTGRTGTPGSSSAGRSRWRRWSPRRSTGCGWRRSCAASAPPTRWPIRAAR